MSGRGSISLALSRWRPSAIEEGMTREELIKALDGHAKQATGLIGIFSK